MLFYTYWDISTFHILSSHLITSAFIFDFFIDAAIYYGMKNSSLRNRTKIRYTVFVYNLLACKRRVSIRDHYQEFDNDLGSKHVACMPIHCNTKILKRVCGFVMRRISRTSVFVRQNFGRNFIPLQISTPFQRFRKTETSSSEQIFQIEGYLDVIQGFSQFWELFVKHNTSAGFSRASIQTA